MHLEWTSIDFQLQNTSFNVEHTAIIQWAKL